MREREAQAEARVVVPRLTVPHRTPRARRIHELVVELERVPLAAGATLEDIDRAIGADLLLTGIRQLDLDAAQRGFSFLRTGPLDITTFRAVLNRCTGVLEYQYESVGTFGLGPFFAIHTAPAAFRLPEPPTRTPSGRNCADSCSAIFTCAWRSDGFASSISATTYGCEIVWPAAIGSARSS